MMKQTFRQFRYETTESFKMAFFQIKANKIRSFLTALGVIIGIVAITMMGTAINGIDRGFDKSLAMLGYDVIYVQKSSWSTMGQWWRYRNRPDLKTEYADQLEQQKNLAWNVSVEGLDGLKSNLVSNVVIRLSDKQHQPIIAATVTMELWRMANSADDQTIQFSEHNPGEYHATIRLTDEGLWLTDLEIVKGEAHYALKQPIAVAGN